MSSLSPAFRMAANAVMARRAVAQISTASQRWSSGMPLTFAAPSGCLYDAVEVNQVDVPSFSGSFGILPNHVPSLAVLKPGVVTVYEADGGETKQFFVSSGSVSINEDSSVQILAEEAHPIDAIDASSAKTALAEAQSSLSAASTDEARVEAQIAVEVAEALVNAAP